MVHTASLYAMASARKSDLGSRAVWRVDWTEDRGRFSATTNDYVSEYTHDHAPCVGKDIMEDPVCKLKPCYCLAILMRFAARRVLCIKAAI